MDDQLEVRQHQALEDGYKIAVRIALLEANENQLKLLLIRNFDDELATECCSLPGGRVDQGEALLSAITRYAQEQLGLKLPSTFLYLDERSYHSPTGDSQLEFIFLAELSPQTDAAPSPEEAVWHPIEELSRLPIPLQQEEIVKSYIFGN